MLKKISLIVLILILIALFLYFDLSKYLSFSYLQSGITTFQQYYTDNPILVILSFFVIYVVSTALSLPGATILTLASGALFGLALGTVLASFASTIGATIAFLVSRYLLKDGIEKKFSDKLKVINDGLENEGAFYLFALRLVPFFPFFLINILMGLTRFSMFKFYWVSQLGMFAGTIIYVNAGTQLASLESVSGILSVKIIVSFVLLGIFPIIAKKIIARIKNK